MRGDAAEMVNRCFRHQHPEAYGGEPPSEGAVPPELRYGRGNHYEGGAALAEEQIGYPDAVPL